MKKDKILEKYKKLGYTWDTKIYDPLRFSSCCKARVYVNSSDEGTSYYVCDECGKPCDGVGFEN